MLTAVSIILTLALLCMPVSSGSANNSRLTINGLKIDSESIDYSSDASITISSAEQDGVQTYGFSVCKDGGEPAGLDIGVGNDSIMLSTGSNERYYVFSQEALTGISGNSLPDSWNSVALLATELSDVFADETSAYAALSEYFDSFITENAVAAEEYDDTIGDKAISGKKIELEISEAHLLKALDSLCVSENSGVSGLASKLLTAVNVSENTDYSSFSELAENNVSEGTIPVTLIIAADEDGTVSRQLWTSDFESGENSTAISTQLDTIDGSVSLTVEFNTITTDRTINIDVNAALNGINEDAQELKGSCTATIETPADGKDADDLNSKEELTIDILSDIESATTKTTVNGTLLHDEAEKSVFTLNIQSSAEEASSVYDVSFTSLVNDSEKPLSVSFTAVGSADSGASPFNGSAVTINSELSADPGAYVLLAGDILNFSKDLTSILGDDFPVLFDSDQIYSAVNALFAEDQNSGITEETAADDNDNPMTEDSETDDSGEFISGSFDSVEAAAAIYSGYTPDIKTPEGYHIQDITADTDSLLAEYVDDGIGYISVFVINDGTVYDEYPVYYENEDGTVYAADLLVNGVNVSIYFPDMSISEAEELFTQMGLM